LIAHHERQLRYDDWANREVVKALRGAGGAVPPMAARLLAHVVATERLWLARMLAEPAPMPVWPDFDVDRSEAESALLPGLWAGFLRGLDAEGLTVRVEYRNSKGEWWTSTVGEILTHVVLHSTYHRGQIASAFRAAGLEPPYTDYIHAARSGFIP
jgi:uncharacterized damage-inducible protein DinB